MVQSNVKIGERLLESRMITKENLQIALNEQEVERQNGIKPRPVGEILIDMKLIEENAFYRFIADCYGLEYINLQMMDLKTNQVKLLPRPIAQQYSIIVVEDNESETIVATHDPYNKFAIEDVKTYLRRENMRIVVASLHAINTKITLHYNIDVLTPDRILARETQTDEKFTFTSDKQISTQNIDDNEVVRKINSLLEYGYARSVSDIHIEPYETETIIRMRIDGAIRPYSKIHYPGGSQSPHNELIASIKIRSGLDIAEKRLPQDGHMHITINGKRINIRTSVIPTYYGEKAVLRYLNQNVKIDDSEHFGMNEADYLRAKQMLDVPNGIIYVTGATGSGKTSTLYMMLDYLAKKEVSIATIEDPIERNIKNVSQMQVNLKAGLTFERGLRAILRQDPDIFLVGETRDEETAQISVRAAITGHLVLSSLHTNDAVSSVTRLLDMQIPRYMVAVSLVGVIAQRLVRKVCHNCGQEYKPSRQETEMLGGYTGKLYRANRDGCMVCNYGYIGRIPVHEIMFVDDEVRRMINGGAQLQEIEDYCTSKQGMMTLSDNIRQLVCKGIITTEEYLRLALK